MERITSVSDPNFHNGWTVSSCKAWLSENNIEHKTYRRVTFDKKLQKFVTSAASIFLKTEKDFDSCVEKYKNWVVTVTKPYDITHIDLLESSTTYIVRKTLIYGKFKYIIDFNRVWHQPNQDIHDWITETFLDNDDVCKSNPVKWNPYSYVPRLYLSTLEDFVLTKLTWGDRIKLITIVATYDDIKSGQ